MSTIAIVEKPLTRKQIQDVKLEDQFGRQHPKGYICGVCRKLLYAPTKTIEGISWCLCKCHYPPIKLRIRGEKK